MESIIVFVVGLMIGSFLNVCIYRIPKGESISYPPSHCVNCGSRIKWYDLIPLISYVTLKGKCRNCNKKISIRYPIFELLNGILFLTLFAKYGMSIDFIKYAFLISLLTVIGIIDFKTSDVYTNTIYTGIIFSVIFIILGVCINQYRLKDFLNFLLGAVIGGGVISLIIIITKILLKKEGMGWGDAEICLVVGMFLGVKLTLAMFFIAFVLGGIIGIILLLMKKNKRTDAIPFGPYIVIASIIVIYFGNELIQWYINLIL